jgi:hypothetical protein
VGFLVRREKDSAAGLVVFGRNPAVVAVILGEDVASEGTLHLAIGARWVQRCAYVWFA